LKLGSKRFWRFASLVAVLSLAGQAATGLMKSKRPNERTLAGIRPGRDEITAPQKKFRELDRDESATEELLWGDICTHRELRLELNASKTVQVVTVDNNYKPEIMAKCLPIARAPSRLKLLATGHGLQLGDRCERVGEIYGKPESESPSVRGSEQLELSLYSFDWAGAGVPQVMEVSCDAASKKVVAITLAASTL
jgi:hypothetical protein